MYAIRSYYALLVGVEQRSNGLGRIGLDLDQVDLFVGVDGQIEELLSLGILDVSHETPSSTADRLLQYRVPEEQRGKRCEAGASYNFV